MALPSGATPVATVSLQTPFTFITLYTLPSMPGQPYFEYKSLSSVAIPATTAVSVPEGAVTAWLYYSPDQHILNYSWNNTQGQSAQSASLPLRLEGLPNAAPSSRPSTPAASTSSTPLANSGSDNSATRTATITTPRASSTSSPKHGVAGGAVAGVAIGCLAAGALIAGLILWLCWRRRKSTTSQDHEASKISLMHQEKGFSAKTTSITTGGSATSPLSGNLPLPLEDKVISGEISKIANSIKNHVQSYYHTGRVSPGLIDYDDVQALGNSLPVSAGTLSTLLGNSATREIALRFCIAWVICTNILPAKNSNSSLLPNEVAECSRRISSGTSASNSQAALLARWRSYTAELLQPTYVRDPFNASDSRNESIQTVIRSLENILKPYADSRMDNEQRRRNLEEITKRSALFAFTLFSQPSTWIFDWREEQGVRSGELCIFPALLQVLNEVGQAVTPPRPFSEPVIRQLDG